MTIGGTDKKVGNFKLNLSVGFYELLCMLHDLVDVFIALR